MNDSPNTHNKLNAMIRQGRLIKMALLGLPTRWLGKLRNTAKTGRCFPSKLTESASFSMGLPCSKIATTKGRKRSTQTLPLLMVQGKSSRPLLNRWTSLALRSTFRSKALPTMATSTLMLLRVQLLASSKKRTCICCPSTIYTLSSMTLKKSTPRLTLHIQVTSQALKSGAKNT